MVYLSYATDISDLILDLNDLINDEIAIPGNWSPQLLFYDIKNLPVKSKKSMAKYIFHACNNRMTYRDFFFKTRGYAREVYNVDIWNLFDSDSSYIMMYFEDYFIKYYQSKNNGKLFPYLVKGEKYICDTFKCSLSSFAERWEELIDSIFVSSISSK